LETERAAAAKAKLLGEQMERLFHDIPAQIAIVRGEELFYDYINPQYQRELFPGRDVLGLPLLTALPEVADQPIWDILQKVYHSGEPYIQQEMLIPLAAVTGGPVTDHYFNLVYQPLRDENSRVYALLSFKYEMTAHVAARKELEEANAKLASSYEELQALHEELQASNEELSATNEQLLQTQSELRLINSQLETRVADRTRELEESFEEQQALNEEISSANEELRSANEELSETQSLLQQSVSGLTASEQRFPQPGQRCQRRHYPPNRQANES
jgi:hypothetical protein